MSGWTAMKRTAEPIYGPFRETLLQYYFIVLLQASEQLCLGAV